MKSLEHHKRQSCIKMGLQKNIFDEVFIILVLFPKLGGGRCVFFFALDNEVSSKNHQRTDNRTVFAL